MNRVRMARAGFVAVLWSVLLCLAGGCASTAVTPADSPATVDAVTLNLWHDKQDWPRRQDAIVADLRARGPDVILLQEVLQILANVLVVVDDEHRQLRGRLDSGPGDHEPPYRFSTKSETP